MKLSLETRNRGDILIVHCQGRIVYRDEAAALSHVVGEVLQNGCKVVIDLSGVTSIDSAGIGELVFLHTRAQSQNADLKVASPSPLVRDLFDLTNLVSVPVEGAFLHAAPIPWVGGATFPVRAYVLAG